jgi:transcriptional regulator with XRE-family HTH domain
MDVEAIRKKIGIRLKELRSAKGLRQEDLDRWGFSSRYYGQLERGLANPTVETLARLCEIFDVTLSDLFLFIDTDKDVSIEREQVAIKLAELLKDNCKTKIKKLRVFLDDIL